MKEYQCSGIGIGEADIETISKNDARSVLDTNGYSRANDSDNVQNLGDIWLNTVENEGRMSTFQFGNIDYATEH